jgi:membrane protease YdiL (CAAX protease family)
MHAIGAGSAAYLIFLLILVPALAVKNAKVFNARASSLPALSTIYLNSLAMLVVLLALAWFVAQTFAYKLFAVPVLGARDWFAGAAALCFQFAMQYVSHAVRTPEEQRTMPVLRLTPRSARERALYSVVSIAAGVAEEAAYRGVLTMILWHALGSVWLAAVSSAVAFAAGHAVQGWKSMAVIFVMACSMQLLVNYTGTLVIAMAVHAIYDLLAPTLRSRIVREPPTVQGRSAG